MLFFSLLLAGCTVEEKAQLAPVLTPSEDLTSLVPQAAAPSPAPTQAPSSPYSAADFANGTAYPEAARVILSDFDVPAGATTIHVPVRLDRASPNTVIAYVRVLNGQGGRAQPDTTKPVIFRPGDPLVKTVAFAVSGMGEGNNVQALQSKAPDGAVREGGTITITARARATNEQVAGGRVPQAFEPVGSLVYAADGGSLKFDDAGGADTFSTSLSHGRTQAANNETGYYGTAEMGGFERQGDLLLMKTFRAPSPIRVGTPMIELPFIAGTLSGHRTTDAQFRYGTVEWQVRMPDRKGSWPALWLVAADGWPPEIDVFEGFYYNSGFKPGSSLSTNLHGGASNRRTFTRSAMNMTMADFGLPNTLDTEFHTFAVNVTPAWITIFVDGVETMQYANPFAGETWYPITGVAVKADPDDPYDQGNGAMEIRSLKVWRAE